MRTPGFPLRRRLGDSGAVRFGLLAVFFVAGCIAQRGSTAEDPKAAAGREQLDDLRMRELAVALADGAAELVAAEDSASFALDDRERRAWDFWPSKYAGARMDRIGDEQRAVVDRMLRLGLSGRGYQSLKLIQALEPYNPWRSPYYSAAVFGRPSQEGLWGWRFQGHHMSLNFTLAGGEVVSATPLFLGTQPLSKPGVGGGEAPLGAHEALARKLYQSLDASQRRQADVSRPGHTYLPLRTPEAEPQEPRGVPASALRREQRETLTALLDAYVGSVAPAIAEVERRKIEAAGFEKISFAWAGADQAGRDHYYRVQGPTFILEYDSRDGGSHIHCVWRSFAGDFGEDVLARHYAAAHRPETR